MVDQVTDDNTNDDTQTPREIDAVIAAKIGNVLDINHELSTICRQSALDWNRISSHYVTLASLAAEIAEDQAALAASTASTAADIIATEWRLNDPSEDDEDDD